MKFVDVEFILGCFGRFYILPIRGEFFPRTLKSFLIFVKNLFVGSGGL